MFTSLIRHMRKLVVAVGALGAAVAFSPTADAAPIGFASFGIGGAFQLPPGTHLGNTNSLTIANNGAVYVTQGDIGDLAGLVTFGGTGTLADIPSLTSFAPITNYLTLASGVRLDLTSITVNSRSGPTPGFLNISGTGTLHAPGFDATEARVSWTGTTSDNITFTLALQSSVPEPISLTLLGLGLLGVAYSRRMTLRTKTDGAAA